MNAFAKRLLTVLGALCLVGYVGYQAYQMLYSPIRTETVYSYTTYETYDTKGIAVRSETLVPSTGSGYMFYTVENGSRVAQNGVIAQRYPSQSDAQKEQKLKQLDEEIALLKNLQQQGTTGRINLDLITRQLDTTVADLVKQMHEPILSGLSTSQSELLTLLNKEQVITGQMTSFQERIDALTAQRNQLAGQYQAATGTVNSPVAGYFVSLVDGYEDTIRFDQVTSLTPEQVEQALNAEPKAVPEGAYAGKVVGAYEWYLACLVPETYVSLLGEGASLTVKFTFVSDEEIPVTVASCKRDKSGQMAVVFRCSTMSKELSSMRIESVQIQLVEHTGLRVPKEAIVTNDAFETGVYVRVGNTVVFRKIEQEYNEAASYSICKVVDEDGYLKLYDDIILDGKGLYNGKIIH